MHIHAMEDKSGDVVELICFCSDSCHQDWCNTIGNPNYEGWNGCHENEQTEQCAECDEKIEGYSEEE